MEGSAKRSTNLNQNIFDRYGRETLFLLNDTRLEIAPPTIHSMVEDAMLFAVGKPDARLVASRKNGNAGRLNGRCEMHGATVVT